VASTDTHLDSSSLPESSKDKVKPMSGEEADEIRAIEKRIEQITAQLEQLPQEELSIRDRAQKHAVMCAEREKLRAMLRE
jgi:hypothetical protein